jgi:DNA-binding transcriptional MerR regulator
MVEKRFTVQELAKSSGVSVASIKYYLREGLLQPGDPQFSQRRYYDARHFDRLRAIRALRDVGQLSIAAISRIFEALDRGGPPFAVVASAIDALAGGKNARSPASKKALEEVRRLLAGMGVKVRPDAGALVDLALALARIRELWGNVSVTELVPYARSARALARLETRANRDAFAGDTQGLLGTAVLGTLLFEPVLIALRRVMHEYFAAAELRALAQTPQRQRPPKRN